MAPDLSITSKRTVGKRIATNTGLMVGSKALAALLGLGSLAIATKSLDGYAFGVIVFLHAYMLFFSEVATFQAWQSIIRFGTDDIKNGDCDRLARLLKFGVQLDALAAILGYALAVGIFGLIMFLAAQIPGLSPPDSDGGIDVYHYLMLYCILILIRQRSTSIGVFRLFDKFSVLAIQSLIMPTLRFLGVSIAALNGAGFEGFLLAWFCGSLPAYIFLPTMGAIELHKRRLLGAVIRARVNFFAPGKGIWAFVWKSNIDSTLAASNLQLPMLLVTAVFGPVWAGIYKIAEEIAKLLSEGFKLLDQVIYPELAKMVSAGEADKIWRLVTRAALILLSFGMFMSVLFLIVGPDLLKLLTTKDYTPAVPLASLLVPAAALLGTAAPLYPIFYAADKPHQAIYARGAGVLVYVLSFFAFSFTIGNMAPAWAAILGNATAVVLVVTMARRTLNKTVERQKQGDCETDHSQCVPVQFIGESAAKLWGLPLPKWQNRALKKAGADPESTSPEAGIVMDMKWVLSSALAAAFVKHPNTVLVIEGDVIATHGVSMVQAQSVIGHKVDPKKLKKLELVPMTPDKLVDHYNKALRKTEKPYALNTEVVAVSDIMQRQFDSSYKGITDFVTKFIWPIPAYYVTRLCAALRLTPNMVTTIGLILMFMALYYFWQGQWALGFITGWLMTFLDTVDGKLARTTMTYSSWGNIYDHGIDLIHPPFWYWAWFIGLGGVFSWPDVTTDPMSFTLAAICVGYVVDRIIEGIFIAQHGFHIHVWSPINSALRFITARRNPNMFIFMIGILLIPVYPQAGIWGFYAVAIWTWLCIAFNIGVVIVGTFKRRPLSSWMDKAA